MIVKRKKTKQIHIGSIPIGNGAPIAIQSMLSVPLSEPQKAQRQIARLAQAGCQIIRIAIPDHQSAQKLPLVIKKSPIPIIADIHYDHTLALAALDAGIHGLRLNPGTLGNKKHIKSVVKAATNTGIPIRVGANSGSLPKKFRHLPHEQALIESVMEQITILEECGHSQIKVSLKSSQVGTTIAAYRTFSQQYDYPLHIGLTESGPHHHGLIKSCAALSVLLFEGIGDTIRISLTEAPIEEVLVAKRLLQALQLYPPDFNIIACPTCGRCNGPVIKFAKAIDRQFSSKIPHTNLTIAIMGCEVNGPHEAKQADLGIAFSADNKAFIFQKGKEIHRGSVTTIMETFRKTIESYFSQ